MTTDGERAMIRLRFYGDIDRRGARRLIRRTLHPTGIRADTRYIDFLIRHRAYDLGID